MRLSLKEGCMKFANANKFDRKAREAQRSFLLDRPINPVFVAPQYCPAPPHPHTPSMDRSLQSAFMFKLETLVDVVALVEASKRQCAVLWQDASGNWLPIST